MRISDWSSDVCSSDLQSLDATLQPVGVEQLVKALPVGHARAADAAQPRAQDRRPGQVGHRREAQAVARLLQADQEAVVAQQAQERRHTRPQLSAGERRRRLQARRCGTGGRSEEHTSELQSLMRISYAVFCLKKKKNTIKRKNK